MDPHHSSAGKRAGRALGACRWLRRTPAFLVYGRFTWHASPEATSNHPGGPKSLHGEIVCVAIMHFGQKDHITACVRPVGSRSQPLPRRSRSIASYPCTSGGGQISAVAAKGGGDILEALPMQVRGIGGGVSLLMAVIIAPSGNVAERFKIVPRRRNRRLRMTVSSDSIETICERASGEGQQIMFLVKRPAYELAIAVRHAPQMTMREDLPHLHVRLKAQCQSGVFVLDLATLKGFQQDLLCLLEYVQTERKKLVASQFSCP